MAALSERLRAARTAQTRYEGRNRQLDDAVAATRMAVDASTAAAYDRLDLAESYRRRAREDTARNCERIILWIGSAQSRSRAKPACTSPRASSGFLLERERSTNRFDIDAKHQLGDTDPM